MEWVSRPRDSVGGWVSGWCQGLLLGDREGGRQCRVSPHKGLVGAKQ